MGLAVEAIVVGGGMTGGGETNEGGGGGRGKTGWVEIGVEEGGVDT